MNALINGPSFPCPVSVRSILCNPTCVRVPITEKYSLGRDYSLCGISSINARSSSPASLVPLSLRSASLSISSYLLVSPLVASSFYLSLSLLVSKSPRAKRLSTSLQFLLSCSYPPSALKTCPSFAVATPYPFALRSPPHASAPRPTLRSSLLPCSTLSRS